MFHLDLTRWAHEVRDEFHAAELVAIERRTDRDLSEPIR